jgi:hypothetical protein
MLKIDETKVEKGGHILYRMRPSASVDLSIFKEEVDAARFDIVEELKKEGTQRLSSIIMDEIGIPDKEEIRKVRDFMITGMSGDGRDELLSFIDKLLLIREGRAMDYDLKSDRGGKMKVKIKKWEKMKEEFGVDADGNIKCTGGFTPSMEDEMPQDRIIEVYPLRDAYIRETNDVPWYIPKEIIEKTTKDNQWKRETI